MSREATIDADLVSQTIAQGFPYLRFQPLLEASFEQHRYRLLLTRTPIVALYAVAMLLVYSISDYAFLPESVYKIAIAIRLLVIVPVLLFVVWSGYQAWSYRSYLKIFNGAYLIAGIGVIAIIAAARLQAVSMPYEGVILITLFGYFLMGIPFYHVVASSLLIFITYVGSEIWVGLPLDTLAYNAFFLLTANFIGAAGCYIHEKTYRKEFLNQLLVECSRDQAERENESKSRLLAAASHDLRQPLHAMTLFTDNLDRELKEVHQKELVHHMQLSIRHLSQLLGSLLDMSRLQFNVVKPHKKKFDVVQLAEQVARESQYGARIEVDIYSEVDECVVYSDAMMLGRILRNLIENALEHAEAESIEVHVEVDGAFCRLSVKDDGMGIPVDALDKIFEEFHQLGQSSHAGLGLGLSIVKQMSSLLGLDVQVESEESKGTCFSLALPIAVLEQVAVKPSGEYAEESIPGTLRLLMLEDAKEVLTTATGMVEQWGFKVDAVTTIDAALNQLEDIHYDLVVTDMHVGEKRTGLDLAHMMRDRGIRSPIVIVTADTSVEIDDDALQPIVVTFKPIRPAKLRVIFQQLLA